MNYRCKSLTFTFLLIIAAVSLIPLVSAQATYTQPMYPIAWKTRTVLVSVPDSPDWAKTDFISAAQVWNQAQQWFAQSYEPNHLSTYYILQVAQSGDVPQVMARYAQDTGQQWWGQYSSGQLSIVLSRFNGTNYDLEELWEHELGHVLGLGDNCVNGDLMFGSGSCAPGQMTAYYPSTLDLYAAYAQAVSRNMYLDGDTVSLPSQISYIQWNPNLVPLPEFPNALFVLVTATLVGVWVRKRRLPLSSLRFS